MPPLLDAHNHLQEEVLIPYVEEVVERARAAGVGEMWCNGTAEADWDRVLQLSRQVPEVVPCFGLHPWFADQRSPGWQEKLEWHLDAGSGAVGEIGLDRLLTRVGERTQEEVFRAQLAIARRRELPAMVHCLKAWGWLLEILRDVGPLPGGLLIHAYGGSGEVVQTLAQMGAYFSFGGAVLDPSRQRAREALRQVPLDRLLLETDAPALLPPAGFRPYVLRTAEGEQYNEPANLPAICEGIAALLGLPTDQLIDLTTENAFRLYPQRRGPGPVAPAGS